MRPFEGPMAYSDLVPVLKVNRSKLNRIRDHQAYTKYFPDGSFFHQDGVLMVTAHAANIFSFIIEYQTKGFEYKDLLPLLDTEFEPFEHSIAQSEHTSEQKSDQSEYIGHSFGQEFEHAPSTLSETTDPIANSPAYSSEQEFGRQSEHESGHTRRASDPSEHNIGHFLNTSGIDELEPSANSHHEAALSSAMGLLTEAIKEKDSLNKQLSSLRGRVFRTDQEKHQALEEQRSTLEKSFDSRLEQMLMDRQEERKSHEREKERLSLALTTASEEKKALTDAITELAKAAQAGEMTRLLDRMESKGIATAQLRELLAPVVGDIVETDLAHAEPPKTGFINRIKTYFSKL